MRDFYWTANVIPSFQNRKSFPKRRYFTMKGYETAAGYMGYVDGTYMLFASEGDYRDFWETDN